MSKMVPITSPDLILSSCMEPGHREPLDQLFKRCPYFLFDPLLQGWEEDYRMAHELFTPKPRTRGAALAEDVTEVDAETAARAA